MPRFLTFTTDSDEDVQVREAPGATIDSLPDDWADYAYQEGPKLTAEIASASHHAAVDWFEENCDADHYPHD